jgi:hypothetical protein
MYYRRSWAEMEKEAGAGINSPLLLLLNDF